MRLSLTSTKLPMGTSSAGFGPGRRPAYGAMRQVAPSECDEFRDVHHLGEVRARAQLCIRADAAVRPDLGLVQLRKRLHLRSRAEGNIAQHAVGPDTDPVAERDAAFEYAVHVD